MVPVTTSTPMMMVMVGVMLTNRHASVRNGEQGLLHMHPMVTVKTCIMILVQGLYSYQIMLIMSSKLWELTIMEGT